MREIVFDTETTGLQPLRGDRIVEVACVELVDKLPTGKVLQHYVNPERDVPEYALKLHGLSTEFLADKPLFRAVADEILEFMGEAPLVAHYGSFDIDFLNTELIRCARIPIIYNRLIDTWAIAKRRWPSEPHSMDALCKKFQIDTSHRDKHGALVDANILAALYGRMCGAEIERPAPKVEVQDSKEQHDRLRFAPRRTGGYERI